MKTKEEASAFLSAQIQKVLFDDTDNNSELHSAESSTQSIECSTSDSNETVVVHPLTIAEHLEVINSTCTEIMANRFAILIEVNSIDKISYRIFKRTYNLGFGNYINPEGKFVWTVPSLEKAKIIFDKICYKEEKRLQMIENNISANNRDFFDLYHNQPSYKKSEAIKQLELMVQDYYKARLPLIRSQFIDFPTFRDDTIGGLYKCIIYYLSLSGCKIKKITDPIKFDLLKHYRHLCLDSDILIKYVDIFILITIDLNTEISYYHSADDILYNGQVIIQPVNSFESVKYFLTNVFSVIED